MHLHAALRGLYKSCSTPVRAPSDKNIGDIQERSTITDNMFYNAVIVMRLNQLDIPRKGPNMYNNMLAAGYIQEAVTIDRENVIKQLVDLFVPCFTRNQFSF
jgi:hypothetical protein